MIKLVAFAAIALGVAFTWYVTRPEPRLVYTTECEAPAVSSAEAAVYADMALAEVSRLLRDAEYIYGPYNRAEQRFFSVKDMLGVPTANDPTYRLRIGAAFSELSLIWRVAMALGQSPCFTQHLVPDHRADSIESASAKLRSLASALI